MADDHLKAVLKSEVAGPYGASFISIHSSNSSNADDLDFEDNNGSTVGLTSNGQVRGRSINEIEEQLSNLKKENFNLKLRIYFLEEKMGTNFTLDEDNIVKKNIELQTEITNLQKEIQEKHELLCQAVRAMELEEEEHKKIISSKEDQLMFCQQELENLRIQLQESKFDSDGMSVKSDTTGFCSSRISSRNNVTDLQEKIKLLEAELTLEKENNASVQFMLSQAETLKLQYDNLQKEVQLKDENIKDLQKKIEAINEDNFELSKQMKELKEKLNQSHQENQALVKKNQAEARKLEDILLQSAELKRKYAAAKAELEKEQKKLERAKFLYDCKVTELEEENQRQKVKIRDLQTKLDSALIDIRKNQNLAVSKSPKQQTSVTNTDYGSLSVSDAATSTGAAETNALFLSVDKCLQSSPTLNFSTETAGDDEENKDKILSDLDKLKNVNVAQSKKIIRLKTEQMQACSIIRSMIDARNKSNDEIAKLKAQVEGLEKELESVVTKPSREGDAGDNSFKDQCKSMAEPECNIDEVSKGYEVLIGELETKITLLEAIIKEKDQQILKIQNSHQQVLSSLDEKDKRIIDLEFELLTVFQAGDESDLSKNSGSPEKNGSFYKEIIEVKNQEIDKLKGELKQCTCYLQEIVNKELWEKNKEIEKLHHKQANSQEVTNLKKDLIKKEQQLRLLKDKISELGLDLCELDQEVDVSKNVEHIKTLQEQLNVLRDERDHYKSKFEEIDSKNYPEELDNLLQQIHTLESELEKSKHLQQKSNEICTLLNNRLEELAVFLDTLLKQKSILGFLGSSKERKLREIINTSMDISKSFAMSMMVNSDQSLMQLSNITTILSGSAFHDLSLEPKEEVNNEPPTENIVYSIEPESITLTYQNHLKSDDKEEIITALREQIVQLESELRLRDNELNRFVVKEVTDKSTETDSEFNVNNVSKLFNNTTSTTLKYHSECQSESEAWSEPDRVVSRARIGLNKMPLNDIEPLLSTEEEAARSGSSITPTKRSGEKRLSFSYLQSQIAKLQDEVQEKTERLRKAEEAFQEQQAKLMAAESKAVLAETLKKSIADLEKSNRKKDEEMELLQEKLRLANELSEKYELELAEVKTALKTIQNELIKIEEEKVEATEKLRAEYEEMALNKVKSAEVEFVKKLKTAEEAAEEKIRLINDELKRDYVKIVEVESKLEEVKVLKSELEDLKNVVKSYEETIEQFRKKEAEFNKISQEYQDKLNFVRKELDHTTLQYSEAILEKTKLSSEKTALEQEMKRNNVKGIELKKELDEIKSELSKVTEDYQQQISSVLKQKSKLEMKMSELESTNAELHNRLIRMQCNQTLNEDKNSSRYKRQFSGSEDNLEEFGTMHPVVQNLQGERQEGASSPDLGIESDHGRFSSLETHSNSNIPRPLQQTLLLTESMSNLVCGDRNIPENLNCDCEHCYEKNLEIVCENNNLKRKLQGMRRALQETVNQLNLANQRKKEVEKTICKQIHKTSQVLRKAKENLDSSSESDMLHK